VSYSRLLSAGPDATAPELLAEVRPRERAPDDRPFVYANLVSTIDGRAQVRGRTGELGEEADLEMLLELRALADAVLIGLALWMGPLIKRFGKSYAADVFRANPRTGKSFIVLTDIAYYLIFFAYVLFTVSFQLKGGWSDTVSGAQLQHEVARVGGILLILGVLHGLNLIALPVMGRLLTLNRRLDEETPAAPPPPPAAPVP